MRSRMPKTFYYHADANALGGFVDKPFHKIIPSQASVALPTVGGYTAARTGAFNFEEIASCRSAYTRISGRPETDGSWTTLITSVVEGLNILEVFKAERLVGQVSITHPAEGGFPVISFTGSQFERVQVGARDVSLELNDDLLASGRTTNSPRKPIRWPLFHETGRLQADKLINSVSGDDFQWLAGRYDWMGSDRELGPDGLVLCSLVDGIGGSFAGRSFGHVLEITDFGRIFFGEILAFPASLQLTMIRAELGCHVHGGVSAAAMNGNGHTVPP